MGIGRVGAALGAIAMVASCAPRPAPPAPVPHPRHAPPPAQPPEPPPPPPADWRDRALAPGDWSHDGQSGILEATFASAGGPLFGLRCDPGGRVTLFRLGVPGGPMTIVTSFGERVLPGSGDENRTIATLTASDPLFDHMVFSRGRFLVRAAAGSELIMPTWPEPARVIEECRG